MEIISNYHEHKLLSYYDLPETEQQLFNSYGADLCDYFKYRDDYYCFDDLLGYQMYDEFRDSLIVGIVYY